MHKKYKQTSDHFICMSRGFIYSKLFIGNIDKYAYLGFTLYSDIYSIFFLL